MASLSDRSNFEQIMRQQTASRTKQQEKAYIGWVNAHLQRRSMNINNLQQDLSNVVPLEHLLDILEKRPFKKRKKYRNQFQKLDAMRKCLKQIQSREHNTNINPFDEQTLVSGQQIKPYLNLIWRIIYNYGIKIEQNIHRENNEQKSTAQKHNNDTKESKRIAVKPPRKSAPSPEQMLKNWCNSLLSEELQISNFTKDWSNGRVLLCLSNQALSEMHTIDDEKVEHMKDKELLNNVLQSNEKHLQIPQLLDANDLIHAPNKEAVMTYVSLLRSAVEAQQEKKLAIDEENNSESDDVIDIEEFAEDNADPIDGINEDIKNEDHAPDVILDEIEETNETNDDINVALNNGEEAQDFHDYAPDIVDVECEHKEVALVDGEDDETNETADDIQVDNRKDLKNDPNTHEFYDYAPDIEDVECEHEELIEGEDDVEESDDLKTHNETTGPTPGHIDSESDDDPISGDILCDNLDLCILCDVTRSMEPWLQIIRKRIREIVHQLKNTFGIGTLRLSFIGYRDWNDDNNNSGAKRIETLPFTKQIIKFESFVEIIEAIGGGDAAEDVLGGIKQALSLSWRAPIRVLYHICDAPAHGTIYHDFFERLRQEQQSLNNDMSFLDGISGDDTDSDDDNKDNDDELLMMESDHEEEVLTPLDEEREAKLARDEYDKWPDKHPQDPNHEDLFSELKQQDIQYYIGTQTHFTDKMVNVFQTYCDSIDYKFATIDLVNASRFFPTLIQAVKDAVRIKRPPENPDIPDLNLDNLLKKKVHFQVHCGIDFGTAGSGFAYSLPGRNEVYTDQNWNNSGRHVDIKTKTNILLDAQGNCIAFGDEATNKYTHTEESEDLFFERFKMALYEKTSSNVDEKEEDPRIDIAEYLTATNGKQLPSRKVLEEAIRFMKEHAMQNLRKKINPNLQIQDVQWILTVPAIWSDRAKSVMKTAAIRAGMIDPNIEGQLIIAFEPDCASLSMLHEINEEARERSAPNIAIESYFKRGDKILLCDLGGGTADIACHEIDEDERIRQIVAPSGGAWGSTYVDQHFFELLEAVFSKPHMEQFKISYPSAYVEFLECFRNAKKTYKMKDKPRVKKAQFHSTFHNIKIPFDFLDFMEEKLPNVQDTVNSFVILKRKGLIRINEGFFEVSYTIWNYLFDQVVDCIIAHCKTLLDLPEMGGCKFLCLVGGFSQSKHLQHKMYRNFGVKSKYNVLIFTPKRPILSVVDGAARMGLNPDFISARTIAKTYGIAIQKDLDEFKAIYPHSQWEKIILKKRIGKRPIYEKKGNDTQMISNKQVVNGVFLPFVRRNTMIKNNDKPIIYWVEPANMETNKVSIKLYDSFECDPMFVEDEREANKIEIELSDEFKKRKEAIPIIFIFNDTTIRVFAYVVSDDGTKQTKEVTIDFDVTD